MLGYPRTNYHTDVQVRLLYGADTMDKLTVKQSYWLEDFISTWDIISQNT